MNETVHKPPRVTRRPVKASTVSKGLLLVLNAEYVVTTNGEDLRRILLEKDTKVVVAEGHRRNGSTKVLVTFDYSGETLEAKIPQGKLRQVVTVGVEYCPVHLTNSFQR